MELAHLVLSLARSTLLVSADTDVELLSPGPDTVLRLSHGKVLADVDPRQPGESFAIQTTRFRVTVKGTIFEVFERSPGDVSVSVSRGLVRVSGSDGSWDVPAGRSWHSLTPAALGEDEISAADRRLLDGIAATGGARATIRIEGPPGFEVSEGSMDLGPAPITWDAPVGRYHFVGTAGAARTEGDVGTASAGATSLLALPAPAPVVAPAPPVTSPVQPAMESSARQAAPRLPQRPARPAPEPAPRPSLPASSSAETLAPPARPPRPEPQLLARLDTPSPPPTVAAAASPGPADPYLEALALCDRGRYDDAAAALRSIAASHGPHAELALYHVAQLEQHQLGNAAEALQEYLRYLRQYPRGALLQEAELSVIELELQRSALQDARAQMDHFLTEHPDGERSPDVHLLRGNLLRQQGDCRAALRDYDKARGDADLEEDAIYFSGRCEGQLEQPEAAAILLRDYLRRFPAGRHAAQARAALDAR